MKRIWIPQAIVIPFILWAFYPDNPYGYYILLRLVCCATFAYLGVQAFLKKKEGWVWVFCLTAIIYNPLFRIYLNREIWSVINLLTIGIAIVSVFVLKKDYDPDPF